MKELKNLVTQVIADIRERNTDAFPRGALKTKTVKILTQSIKYKK